MWVAASAVTPGCTRRAPHPSLGLPSCSQAGPGTVSSKRFPSRGLWIMHLEQRSLIQVCDLSENQIPVISPAIWPCVCGPRTGGWTRSRAGGRGRMQGSSIPPRATPRHHSKHPPKQCPKHHPKHRPEHPPSHGGESRGGQGHPHLGAPPCRNCPGEHFGDAPGCACATREAGPRGQPCRDAEEVNTSPEMAPGGRGRSRPPAGSVLGEAAGCSMARGAGGPRAPLPTPHSQLIKALPLF